MKILSANQIKALDAYTIKEEPITSIDLMERAANAFVNWFVDNFPISEKITIKVFCGGGNNGGDGLAIARLLHRKFYSIEIYHCDITSKTSSDFQKNLKRLPRRHAIPFFTLATNASYPTIEEKDIIIDAIFGTGLNRPLEGYWKQFIQYLNQSTATKIAVDIPSGLFADQTSLGNVVVKADYTLSFELPKFAFFFPENQYFVGQCHIQPIGLHQEFMETIETPHYFLNAHLVKSLLKPRNKFDHKGTFGHALIIGGSYGKVGAAILAARACLRSGAGLVSVHAPQSANTILQVSFPEAMVSVDTHQYYYSENPNLQAYRAIGCGCGLDQKPSSQKALKELLRICTGPLVLDADALNILSANPDWLELLPKNSILTPHPKEFERLFGPTANNFDRNKLQCRKAKELGIFLILKGANTCIATPNGDCLFNTTGNPGMATAGSGDVLTGVITGLLAQSYSRLDACILGVYLHGLSGDIAAKELGHESLIASDLVQNLGKAFQKMQ